jgi:DNA-binding CsgD family transcriptional regulator
MFEINRVRQRLQEYPEEAASYDRAWGWSAIRETLRPPPVGVSAWAAIMRMFAPPPETKIALRLLRANREGGGPAAWRCFEQHTDLRPDSLLVARLRPALDSGIAILPARLGRLLDEHRKRLLRHQEAARIPVETERLRRGIRCFPSLDASLEALRVAGQTREEALWERIPGVAYIEKAESPPGSNIAGAVGSAIRKEGLERPDHPDLITPLTHEIRDDLNELVAFFRREELRDLQGDASRAGLSAQEQQVFTLALDGLGNDELAAQLSRSSEQVRQEKHRAFKKIRRYRQAAGL